MGQGDKQEKGRKFGGEGTALQLHTFIEDLASYEASRRTKL